MNRPPNDCLTAGHRIVFFGDSILAGARIVRKVPDQVQDRLARSGRRVWTFNAGVAGSTTADGLNRLDDAFAFAPDLMIVMFGTNDAAIDVWADRTEPRTPHDEYIRNLNAMLDAAAEHHADAILMTPPPMVLTDELGKLYGKPPYTQHGFNFMLDRYVATIRSIAETREIPLVDVNGVFQRDTGGDEAKLLSLLADGMHPSQAGGDRIASLISETLETELSAEDLNDEIV